MTDKTSLTAAEHAVIREAIADSAEVVHPGVLAGDSLFIFWSDDGERIRMWTKDIERARWFATHSGLKWQYFAEAWCVECGDGITAHDPGVCGTCYAMKYEAPAAALADREVK